MADWGITEMAKALPTIETVVATDEALDTSDEVATVVKKNPQEAGWAPKQYYDYETYNKTSKQLLDEGAATGGAGPSDWASNAAKYEWNDEYGDVGPRFPELEEQLFGSEHHVRTGIDFAKIQMIEVVQEGTIKVQPVRSFAEAGLHPVMLENVELAGYTVPTPVQAYCLPAILKGHDIVACAQTGSGKTAAFLIPTLSKLMGKAKKLAAPRPNPATFREGIDQPVRAEPLLLVVCPSRELATQIFDEARRFCYRTMLRPCVLYGGGPVVEQMQQLQKGCDVLIATPGRLCDFIERPHVLSLHRLKYTIIDEADEMLNSDWETELKKIMTGGDQEIGNITYMMFSATFPKSARDLAKEQLAHDHIRIRVGRAGSSHENIKQNIVFVEASIKRKALLDLLFAHPPARTIIFVNSKRSADELDDYLFNLDLPCTSIHSDRTQREREDAIRAFRIGKTPILIATGVSARGLDLRNVCHVVNYDLPSVQYGGIEEYVHRIGRTGRIGNLGLATSFYNDRDEDLGPVLTNTLLETKQPVPDFLQQYVPEGGENAKLKFEADSDFGDDEGTGFGDAGGGLGGASGGWGAPGGFACAPAEATATPNVDALAPAVISTPVVAASTAGGDWGAPAKAELVAKKVVPLPVKAAPLPVKAAPPPVKAAPLPVKAAPPPVKAAHVATPVAKPAATDDGWGASSGW